MRVGLNCAKRSISFNIQDACYNVFAACLVNTELNITLCNLTTLTIVLNYTLH